MTWAELAAYIANMTRQQKDCGVVLLLQNENRFIDVEYGGENAKPESDDHFQELDAGDPYLISE